MHTGRSFVRGMCTARLPWPAETAEPPCRRQRRAPSADAVGKPRVPARPCLRVQSYGACTGAADAYSFWSFTAVPAAVTMSMSPWPSTS